MLQSGMIEAIANEANVSNTRYSIFLLCMRYLYTQQLGEEAPDDLIDLVPLGEQYLISSIKYLAEVFISCEFILTEIKGPLLSEVDVDNSAYLYSFALLYDLPFLMDSCKKFIKANLKEVQQTAAFKNLTWQELKELGLMKF